MFQRYTGTLMPPSQYLKFQRQMWKQMYLRHTGSLYMCVSLNMFWTYCLSTDQLINVQALKFLQCKPDDFLSICGLSCMAFVKKYHSAHQIERKPVHAQCLGLVDVWQLGCSYCSALAAKHLEVSRKMQKSGREENDQQKQLSPTKKWQVWHSGL